MTFKVISFAEAIKAAEQYGKKHLLLGKLPNTSSLWWINRPHPPMLFDDAKREEAGALGLLNRFHKVSRGQFLPLDGERLRQGAARGCGHAERDAE